MFEEKVKPCRRQISLHDFTQYIRPVLKPLSVFTFRVRLNYKL